MRKHAVRGVLVGYSRPSPGSLLPREPTFTNGIGMQFVLIKPGSMQVGVYQPTCPDPNAPARERRSWHQRGTRRIRRRIPLLSVAPGRAVRTRRRQWARRAWRCSRTC